MKYIQSFSKTLLTIISIISLTVMSFSPIIKPAVAQAAACDAIGVGNFPYSATAVGTNLYVLNLSSNSVSIIDTTTNTVTETVSVGAFPLSATIVGTDLYVNNLYSSSISIIDTTTNAIKVCSTPPVITPPVVTPTQTVTTSGGISYGCKDPKASNYDFFSASKPSLCKYNTNTNTNTPTPTTLPKGICPVSQQLTQNLKSGSRNGKYNSYTKGIVKEANILQSHLNRLGFSSGKEDGILGPISDGAIKRMQTFLNTKADGYVGPLTRGLLNDSCAVKS